MKPLKINLFLQFNFMGAQFLLHVGQLCCNNCKKIFILNLVMCYLWKRYTCNDSLMRAIVTMVTSLKNVNLQYRIVN